MSACKHVSQKHGSKVLQNFSKSVKVGTAGIINQNKSQKKFDLAAFFINSFYLLSGFSHQPKKVTCKQLTLSRRITHQYAIAYFDILIMPVAPRRYSEILENPEVMFPSVTASS